MKFKTKTELAKYTIEYLLNHNQKPRVVETEIDDELKRIAACFVTVYVDKDLRGCIGNAEAVGPLYKGIIDNAVVAVTSDFRFEQIRKDELQKLEVKVSVLTPLEEYKPGCQDELISYLKKEKPGLVIEKGYHRALFLPQVWEQLPEPQDFLSRLCQKAGLPPQEWKKDIKTWTFRTS